jgi:hypothetical protein
MGFRACSHRFRVTNARVVASATAALWLLLPPAATSGGPDQSTKQSNPFKFSTKNHMDWREWCIDWEGQFNNVWAAVKETPEMAGLMARDVQFECRFTWVAGKNSQNIVTQAGRAKFFPNDRSVGKEVQKVCNMAMKGVQAITAANFPKCSNYPTWSQKGLFYYKYPGDSSEPCVYPPYENFPNDNPKTYDDKFQKDASQEETPQNCGTSTNTSNRNTAKCEQFKTYGNSIQPGGRPVGKCEMKCMYDICMQTGLTATPLFHECAKCQ